MMELEVHFHDRPCGYLSIDNERMSFRYSADYLAANGPPISLSMPLREQVWPDSSAFPFFENLLPEGNIRQLLANRLETAVNNFSRLLEATGGDVAGAISISIPNLHSMETISSPEALSDAELGQVLEQIKTHPFLQNDAQGMRLSLAGAQNKLPVIIDDIGNLHLPGQRLSTHILKPPAERFPALVENEYFCMRAAAACGLAVPQVTLRNFVSPQGQNHDCYIVSRYDRSTIAGVTSRIHQEDMCQITGTVSALKYTQDGGPGFAALFQTTRQYTSPPAVHQQELIRRILFNMMIGNQDAHAKNFSFLHRQQGVTVSPAYDLVSTLVYEELHEHFAMPFGHATSIQALDAAALDEFQQQTGISLRRQSQVLRRFVDLALKAVESEAALVKAATWPDSHAVIDQIVKISQHHASKLREWLT